MRCFGCSRPENAPVFLLPDLDKIESTTIVYLNVRSLRKKHPFFSRDTNLLAGDVLVFSETYVTDQQKGQFPLEGFPFCSLNEFNAK